MMWNIDSRLSSFLTDTDSTTSAANQVYSMSTFGKLNGCGVSSQSTAKELQRLRCQPTSSSTPSKDLGIGVGGGHGHIGPLKANHSILMDSPLHCDREIVEINQNATPSKVVNTQQQQRRPPPPPPPPLPPPPQSSSFSPLPKTSSSLLLTKRPMSAAAFVPETSITDLIDDDTAPCPPSSLPSSCDTSTSSSTSATNKTILYTDDINEPIRPRSASRRRAYIIKRPQSAPLFGKITPRPLASDSDNSTNSDSSTYASSIPIVNSQPKITPNLLKGTISIQRPKNTKSFLYNTDNPDESESSTVTSNPQNTTELKNNDSRDLTEPRRVDEITTQHQPNIEPHFAINTISLQQQRNTKSFLYNDEHSNEFQSNVLVKDNPSFSTHHTYNVSSHTMVDSSMKCRAQILPILEEECGIDRKERVTVRHIETIIIPSPRVTSDASIILNSSLSDDKEIANSNCMTLEKSAEINSNVPGNGEANISSTFASDGRISDNSLKSCVKREKDSFQMDLEDIEVSQINMDNVLAQPNRTTNHKVEPSENCHDSRKIDADEAEFFSSVVLSSTARDSPRSYKNEITISREMQNASFSERRDIVYSPETRADFDNENREDPLKLAVDDVGSGNANNEECNDYADAISEGNGIISVFESNNQALANFIPTDSENNDGILSSHILLDKEKDGENSTRNKTEMTTNQTSLGLKNYLDVVGQSGSPYPTSLTTFGSPYPASQGFTPSHMDFSKDSSSAVFSGDEMNTDTNPHRTGGKTIATNLYGDGDDDDDIVLTPNEDKDNEFAREAETDLRDIPDLKNGHMEGGLQGEVFIPNLRLCSVVGDDDSMNDSGDINAAFNGTGGGSDLYDTSSEVDYMNYKDGEDSDVGDDNAFEDDDDDVCIDGDNRFYSDKTRSPFKVMEDGESANSAADARFCDTDTMVDKIYIPALLGKIDEEERSFSSERNYFPEESERMSGIDKENLDGPISNCSGSGDLVNDNMKKVVRSDLMDEAKDLIRNRLEDNESDDPNNQMQAECRSSGVCLDKPVLDGGDTNEMARNGGDTNEMARNAYIERQETITSDEFKAVNAGLPIQATPITSSDLPTRHSDHEGSDKQSNKDDVLQRKLNKNGLLDPLPGLSEPLAADIDTDDEPVVSVKKKSPFKRFFARKKGKYNPSTDFDMTNSVLPTFEEKKDSAKKTKSHSPTLSRKKKNKLTIEPVKSITIVDEKSKNTKKGKKDKNKEKPPKPGKIDKSNIVVIKSSGNFLSQSMVDIAGEQNTDMSDHPDQLSPLSDLDMPLFTCNNETLEPRNVGDDEFDQDVQVDYANVGEENTDTGEDDGQNSFNFKNPVTNIKYCPSRKDFEEFTSMSSPEVIELGNDMGPSDVYVNTSETLSSCTSSFVGPTSPEGCSSSSFDKHIGYCDSSSDVMISNPTDSDQGGDSENPMDQFSRYPDKLSQNVKLNPLFSSPEASSDNMCHKNDRDTFDKTGCINDFNGKFGSKLNRQTLYPTTVSSSSENESGTLPASDTEVEHSDCASNQDIVAEPFTTFESSLVPENVNAASNYPRHTGNRSLSRKLSSIETTESDNETDEALLAAASEFPLNRPKYGKVPILDENGSIVKRHSETHLNHLDDPEMCSPFEDNNDFDTDPDFVNTFIPRAKLKKSKSIIRDRIECGDVSLEAESDQIECAVAVLGISLDSSQDDLDFIHDKDVTFHDDDNAQQFQSHGVLNNVVVDDSDVITEKHEVSVKGSTTLHRSPSEVLVAAQVHRTVLDDSSSSLPDFDAKSKLEDEVKADNGAMGKVDKGGVGISSGEKNIKNVGTNEYLSSMGFAVKYLSNVSGVLEKDDSVDLETMGRPLNCNRNSDKVSSVPMQIRENIEGLQTDDNAQSGSDSHNCEVRNKAHATVDINEKEVTDSMLEFFGLNKGNDKTHGAAIYTDGERYDDVAREENCKEYFDGVASRDFETEVCENDISGIPQKPKVTPTGLLKLEKGPKLEMTSRERVYSDDDDDASQYSLQGLASQEFKLSKDGALDLPTQLSINLENDKVKEQEEKEDFDFVVPEVSNRVLLSRKHCKTGFANLDKQFGNDEENQQQHRNGTKSPEGSSCSGHSEIENKDMITAAMKDLDDFVQNDLIDGEEESNNRDCQSIASIVNESNLSLMEDREGEIRGDDAWGGMAEVTDDVMVKSEKVTDSHSVPDLFNSMARTGQTESDVNEDEVNNGIGISIHSPDTFDDIINKTSVEDGDDGGEETHLIHENGDLNLQLQNNASLHDVITNTIDPDMNGTPAINVVVEDEGNNDETGISIAPDIPPIPLSRKPKPVPSNDDSNTLHPNSAQTSQSVLEEEYEEVVDKIVKTRKYSYNKSYDEISDNAADSDKDPKSDVPSNPTPKKFVFPWKKKEKENIEKKASSESPKAEKSKSKDKETKNVTNKDTKAKSDGKSKLEIKKKPAEKSKPKSDKSKSNKADAGKKHKKTINRTPSEDDIYHEIEDNQVESSKAGTQAQRNVAAADEGDNDSSQSDYEPVNYIKDEEDKKEEPELRHKQLRKKLFKQRVADSCGYEIPATHQAELVKVKDNKKKKKEKKEKKKKKKKGDDSPQKSDDTGSQSSQLEADDENLDLKEVKRNKKVGADAHDDNDDVIIPYLTFQYPRFIDNGDIYVDSPLSSSPDFEHFKKEKKSRPSSYSGVGSFNTTSSTKKKSKHYAADVPLSAVETREDRKEREFNDSPFSFSPPSLMGKDEVSLTEAFAKAFPSFSGDFSIPQTGEDGDGETETGAKSFSRPQSPLVIQQTDTPPDKSKWRMGLSHGIGSVSPEVLTTSADPNFNFLSGTDGTNKEDEENDKTGVSKKTEDKEVNMETKPSKRNLDSKKVAVKTEKGPEVDPFSKKAAEKKNKKEKKSKGGFFFKRFEKKKEAAAAETPSPSSSSLSLSSTPEKAAKDIKISDQETKSLNAASPIIPKSKGITAASLSYDDRNVEENASDTFDDILTQVNVADPVEDLPTYENSEENTDMDTVLSKSNKPSFANDEYPDSPSLYARIKKASLSKSQSLEAINQSDEYTQQQQQLQQRFDKTVSLFNPPGLEDENRTGDSMDSAATRNIEISKDPELFFSECKESISSKSKAPNLKSLFPEPASDNGRNNEENTNYEEDEEVEYDTAYPMTRLESVLQGKNVLTLSSTVPLSNETTEESDGIGLKDDRADSDFDRNFSPDAADCVFFCEPEKSQSFVNEDHWKDYSPLEIGKMTTKETRFDSLEANFEKLSQTENKEVCVEDSKPKLANRTFSLPPAVPVAKARRFLPARANSEVTDRSSSRNEDDGDNEDEIVQFDDIWKAGDNESPRFKNSEDSREVLLPDENSETFIMPKMRKYSPGSDILGMTNHINLPTKQKPPKMERQGSQRESMYIVKGKSNVKPTNDDSEDEPENERNVGKPDKDDECDNFNSENENDDDDDGNEDGDICQSSEYTGSVTDEYDVLPIRMRRVSSSRQEFPPFQPVVPTSYVSSSSKSNNQQQPSTPTSPIEYTGIQKQPRMQRESSTVYASPWTENDIVEQLTPKLPPRQYRRSESEDPLTSIQDDNSLQASRISLTSVDLRRSESTSAVTSPSSTLRKSVSLSFGLNNDSFRKTSGKKKDKRKKGADGVEDDGEKEEKVKKAISFKALTSLFRRKKSKKDKESDQADVSHNDNWQLQRPSEDTRKDQLKDKPSTKDKSKKGGKGSSKLKSSEKQTGAISVSAPGDRNSWDTRPVCRLVRVNEDGTREVELTRQGGGRLGVLFAKGMEDGVEDGLFINSFHDKNTSKLFSGILCVGDEVLDIDGQDVHYLTLEEVKAIIGLKVTMALRIMPSTIARSSL